MERTDFTNPSGRLLEVRRNGRAYLAFLPDPLPPAAQEEAVRDCARALADASRTLGLLDGIGRFLPNPELFVRPYMRREAVCSSRIEGTVTSFTDLVAFETGRDATPALDVREVHNYVVALDAGLRWVEGQGITAELVRRLHQQLMSGDRGERYATPGEFRTVQNHIGVSRDPAEAAFVPPPPGEMQDALDALFAYLATSEPDVPVLVEAAWMHYQFETIHPFPDGNGRLGRLLIPLLIAHRERMSHPLLYLSPYFERHRSAYYRHLFAVSAQSAWTAWLRFFLDGVCAQANEAAEMARGVTELAQDWHSRLDAAGAPQNAHRTADLVLQRVALDARMIERELGVAVQTAYSCIASLAQVGILHEFTGRPRGRVYLAHELVAVLDPSH